MNPTLAALAAITIFSLGTLLYVLALEVPVYQFLAMKFAIGGLSIMAFDKLRGRNVLKEWRQPIKSYLLVGAAFGLYNFFLVQAFHLSPAFEVNILNYLWPILIAVFAVLIGGEKLSKLTFVSIALGFAGAILIFLPNDPDNIFANLAAGHVLAIAGAILWAFYSVSSRKHNYKAGFLAPVMLLVATCFAILHLAFEEFYKPDMALWMIIVLAGITRFCYVLWDYAIRNGHRMSLSALSYLTPLLSTLLFIAFDYKPASPYVALGGALIIGGCLVASAPRFWAAIRKRRA